MTGVTLRLLNRKPPRNAIAWKKVAAEVCQRLVDHYPESTLGNFRDPVKEIIYIVLSAKTTERLYRRAFRSLRSRFAAIGDLASASVDEVFHCIEGGGLGRKRAGQLLAIAEKLNNDFGATAAKSLRSLEPEEAYSYLTHLPGVGPKSALCVMMYSLDIDVFPVDANVQRVFCRMGAIRKHAKHYEAQQRLPAYVPEGLSKRLHVALVQHGRATCTPRTPDCEECCIADLCKTGKLTVSAGR